MALRTADADGLVGPTAPSGWTTVCVDDEDLVGVQQLGFSTYLWGTETASGPTLELKESGNRHGTLTWTLDSDLDHTARFAKALVGQVGPTQALAGLQALLGRRDVDVDSLWEGLEALLDLPPLLAPEPDRCLVVTTVGPDVVRLAAAIAGPTWVLPREPGWTITVPTPHEESPAEALAAGISGGGRRRDTTVLLWAHGDAFGLQVWRRGSIDAAWSWSTQWETVVSDSLEVETAMCEAVAVLNRELHQPSMRALLRRDHLDDADVISLLELLGLPDGVAEVLRASEAPEGIPGAELVQRTTARHATLAALRSSGAHRGPIRNRPLYLAYAMGTALAAMACLAMTCLGIAVLVTNGSVVDQAGATTEDRLMVGLFGTLTLILTPTAIRRLRRARDASEEVQPRQGDRV
jgi:hypothetical protein